MIRPIAYLCFAGVLTLVSACTKESPSSSDVLPREVFVNLYADMLVAGEAGLLPPKDSVKAASTIDSLFTTYGVTEGQVRRTVEEYSKDLNRWKEFYGEVMNRLEELQNEEREKKGP
jgi:hypothetical protein